MTEGKRRKLDEYPTYIAGTIEGGPLVIIDRLVPGLSEILLRLRVNAELLNDHLPFEDEACLIHGRLMRQVQEIEKEIILFEEAARQTCRNAVAIGETAVSELCERVVDANCACAMAEQQAAKLKDRLAWVEADKEARLLEHNPSFPEVRSKVLALTGGKCAYCDQDVSDVPGDGKATMHVDHIVPKSAGGPDHICNYVPSCERCNISKSAGHVLGFIQRRMTSVRVQLLDAAE